MIVYATSNSGLDGSKRTASLHYIGTSINEAEKAVGNLSDFQQDDDHFPNQQTRKHYSALPTDMEREMIQFYICDGWWSSIEMFQMDVTLEAEEEIIRRVNNGRH